MTRVKRTWLLTILGILSAFLGCPVSQAEEPVVLGAVEEVKVLPWGVTLLARVDTGAAKSSVAALDLKVKGKTAEFRFPDPGSKEKIRLPILGWVEVRTNLGKEKRPLVLMEICVAGRRFQTPVNLDDRSGLKYPMLLGRDTLRGRFLVDVARSHLHGRPCPKEMEKDPHFSSPESQTPSSPSGPQREPSSMTGMEEPSPHFSGSVDNAGCLDDMLGETTPCSKRP
jgi:hypothetical protein